LHLKLKDKKVVHLKTFEELGVAAEIVRAVTEMGFEHPMPVQEAVIPYLLGENNDVVALAQTGTGKTAAFGLPTLQKVDSNSRVTQALVLCPTRELCLQIAGDLDDFSKYLPGVHIVPVYGGTNIEPQIRTLKQGVQVIVATPGRLIDLMERGAAHLEHVNTVILDEADEMLSMGFTDSLNTILEQVPENRNILLFSATMSKEIERISQNYLHDAKEIVVGSRNEGSENVTHVYYMVQAKDKYFALKRIVDYYPKIYGIIFCRTKRETQEVADKLIQDGYNADALHGDLSQQQRDLTMQKFRQHNTQLLVATDVAARGLDVDDLSHVINYGMPDDIENYTHRSGRTGRAGKKGTSICIIHVRERSKIREIEKVIGKEFVEGDIPSGKDICAKQLYKVIDDIERVEVDEEEIADFLPEVYRKLEWLDKEELIKRVVSSEFGRFLRYYANAPEIEKPLTSEQRKSRKKGTNGAEEGYTRIFLNVGKLDGFYAREIMTLVNRYVGDVEVGRIDLMRSFSFFEVPEADAPQVLQALSGANIKGRTVNVEIAGEKQEGKSHESKSRSGKSRDSKNRDSKARDSKPRASKSRGDGDDNSRSERRSKSRAERRKEARVDNRGIHGAGRSRYGQDPFVEEQRRQEREDEFLSGKRKAKKDDWKQFFMQDNGKKRKNNKKDASFELRGEEPDFAEEGWARRKPKKK
jgi:ATP-dependent RNA helicase DeaD